MSYELAKFIEDNEEMIREYRLHCIKTVLEIQRQQRAAKRAAKRRVAAV
jgi:hypothetical protein